MAKLVWGQASQLTFADQEEYYVIQIGLILYMNLTN